MGFQIGDYAVKAREGKIKIEDLQGGVFTGSNGGVYGSLLKLKKCIEDPVCLLLEI